MRTATTINPITNSPTDQISRPAGCIHGNQSGITLGMWPLVLRKRAGGSVRLGFLSRYLSDVPIVGSWMGSLAGGSTGCSARDDAGVNIPVPVTSAQA